MSTFYGPYAKYDIYEYDDVTHDIEIKLREQIMYLSLIIKKTTYGSQIFFFPFLYTKGCEILNKWFCVSGWGCHCKLRHWTFKPAGNKM